MLNRGLIIDTIGEPCSTPRAAGEMKKPAERRRVPFDKTLL
jgi:hypothetical protein